MRIAMLTHDWPGARMGGIGSYVYQCSAALARSGHDVHVFTLRIPADARAAVPAGVTLHEAADPATRVHEGTLSPLLASVINGGGDGTYRLALAWALSAELLRVHREHPFDVVESPDVEALALPLTLDPTFDAPVITHLHCCTAIGHMANGVEIGAPERLRFALEYAGIHLADGLCAPTHYIARETERFVPLPQPVQIIPYPFVSGSDPFVEPPANGPMLFLGRMERRKGVHLIADALNVVLNRHPDATFRFVGPDTNSAPGTGGSMCQYIRSRLSPELAGRVHFTGELARRDIERELRACSFCVLPSLWENYPLACCEAFAAGRTAIVGDGTGSVELMGDAGLIAERDSVDSLADQMTRLWTDHDLRTRLSRRAYDRIRDVSAPDRVSAVRVAYYAHVIESWTHRRDLLSRLATLPRDCATGLLPALVALTGQLAGATNGRELTPGGRLLAIMGRIEREQGQPAQVLLYGAGRHTARVLSERHAWESRGHRVVGLIDDHPRFVQTPVHLDLPVTSVRAATEAAKIGGRPVAVVLSTDTYQDQFWDQTAPLRDAGVAVYRLYT